MSTQIKVTKHWRISRILKDIPDSVELFLEYDLDCFSCSSSDTERLAQGLESHGYNQSQIEEFVDRLQLMLDQKTQAELTPIDPKHQTPQTLSDGSLQVAGLVFKPSALQALAQLKEPQSTCFRIQVQAGGCMGYSYNYSYHSKPPTNTTSFDLLPGLNLALDLYSYHKLSGSNVEYIFSLKDSGLKIINPNTQTQCHCGKSVGF